MPRFADLKIWVRLTAAIWVVLAIIWAGAIVWTTQVNRDTAIRQALATRAEAARPAFQLLIYPVVDATSSSRTSRVAIARRPASHWVMAEIARATSFVPLRPIAARTSRTSSRAIKTAPN